MNATSLGPFDSDVSSIKKGVFNVQIMSLNFKIHQYINPYAGAEGTCYIESITQRFSFAKRGVVTVDIDNHRTTCDTISFWKLDHPGEPEPEE